MTKTDNEPLKMMVGIRYHLDLLILAKTVVTDGISNIRITHPSLASFAGSNKLL